LFACESLNSTICSSCTRPLFHFVPFSSCFLFSPPLPGGLWKLFFFSRVDLLSLLLGSIDWSAHSPLCCGFESPSLTSRFWALLALSSPGSVWCFVVPPPPVAMTYVRTACFFFSLTRRAMSFFLMGLSFLCRYSVARFFFFSFSFLSRFFCQCVGGERCKMWSLQTAFFPLTAKRAPSALSLFAYPPLHRSPPLIKVSSFSARRTLNLFPPSRLWFEG